MLIVGRNENSLVGSVETENKLLHKDALPHFIALKSDAQKSGFDLTIASSYRSFERQSTIWNEKASGIRSVVDDFGKVIDIDTLSEWELVQAILRWSALPGASRHHWGTDMDVYDKAQIKNGYELQLSHDETCEEGIFSKLHSWLSEMIKSEKAHGFYRPYEIDCGGIGCEPWHLSYRPLAEKFSALLSIDLVASIIKDADLLLGETILRNLDEIYERYICLQDNEHKR